MEINHLEFVIQEFYLIWRILTNLSCFYNNSKAENSRSFDKGRKPYRKITLSCARNLFSFIFSALVLNIIRTQNCLRLSIVQKEKRNFIEMNKNLKFQFKENMRKMRGATEMLETFSGLLQIFQWFIKLIDLSLFLNFRKWFKSVPYVYGAACKHFLHLIP